MMQFGMPTLVESRSLAEDAALCSSLGLQFIELNMNFPEYRLECLEQTGTLLKIADKAGIYYTIHLDEYLNVADINQLVASAYLETVRRTIQAARKLLCLRDQYGDVTQPLVLNMHMVHGTYVTLPDRVVEMYDRDFETYMRSFAVFRSLCEEWSEDGSVMIVIENTDGFRHYEQKSIEYLLESPNFGLTWDIGHSKVIVEADQPLIMAHRGKLTHFHIHDGRERPPRNHLALGDGEIDLMERINLARDRNARCVLETKTADALRRSVKWLQEHGLKAR